VRVYILVVTTEVVLSLAVTMLVLAGLVPDSRGLRIALLAGLLLLLITLLTRISVDIIQATAPPKKHAESAASAANRGSAPNQISRTKGIARSTDRVK
jgi:hypothetical protein